MFLFTESGNPILRCEICLSNLVTAVVCWASTLSSSQDGLPTLLLIPEYLLWPLNVRSLEACFLLHAPISRLHCVLFHVQSLLDDPPYQPFWSLQEHRGLSQALLCLDKRPSLVSAWPYWHGRLRGEASHIEFHLEFELRGKNLLSFHLQGGSILSRCHGFTLILKNCFLFRESPSLPNSEACLSTWERGCELKMVFCIRCPSKNNYEV